MGLLELTVLAELFNNILSIRIYESFYVSTVSEIFVEEKCLIAF